MTEEDGLAAYAGNASATYGTRLPAAARKQAALHAAVQVDALMEVEKTVGRPVHVPCPSWQANELTEASPGQWAASTHCVAWQAHPSRTALQGQARMGVHDACHKSVAPRHSILW